MDGKILAFDFDTLTLRLGGWNTQFPLKGKVDPRWVLGPIGRRRRWRVVAAGAMQRLHAGLSLSIWCVATGRASWLLCVWQIDYIALSTCGSLPHTRVNAESVQIHVYESAMLHVLTVDFWHHCIPHAHLVAAPSSAARTAPSLSSSGWTKTSSAHAGAAAASPSGRAPRRLGSSRRAWCDGWPDVCFLCTFMYPCESELSVHAGPAVSLHFSCCFRWPDDGFLVLPDTIFITQSWNSWPGAN